MKVLLPIEDRLFGEAIVAFIAKHDWPQAVSFRLMHVIQPVLHEYPNEVPYFDLLERSIQDEISNGKKLLAMLAGEIASVVPHANISHELFEGMVKDEISKQAFLWDADLIVVGSHGRKGFGRLVLGSVSLSLVTTSDRSVLVVRPDAETLSRWEKSVPTQQSVVPASSDRPARVLVAVDCQQGADTLVDFIAHHKWGKNAHFRILNVVEPQLIGSPLSVLPSPILTDRFERLCNEGREIVNSSSDRLKETLPEVNVDAEVIDGFPKQDIVEFARRWQADLIVVGSHGRGDFERLFIGSVSLAVLCSAPCAVLVIKSPKQTMKKQKSRADAKKRAKNALQELQLSKQ